MKKNLYERLIPKHREELLAEHKQYPFVIDLLSKQLSQTDNIFDMSYHTVYTLVLHTSIDGYQPSHLIDAFGYEPVLEPTTETNEQTHE